MPQASSLNTILGDTTVKNAAKKNAGKSSLEMLAANKQNDIFGKLIAGLTGAHAATKASAILAAGTGKKGAATQLDLQTLQLTPELAAALKSLKAEDLQSLPPEIAAVFARHLNADGTLDAQTIGVLDALSAGTASEGASADLYTLVSDPQLAEILRGLSARLAGQKADAGVTAAFASLLPGSVSTGVTAPAMGADGKPGETTITMTIADLDGEGFQALKKLAFADIAPYLTAPRVVHASGNTVMKVAQGPSFLNDETTTASMLTTMGGMGATVATGKDGTIGGDAATLLPQQQSVFNRGALMAALLGAAPEQPQAQNAQNQAGQATASTTAKGAEAPANPLLAGNAAVTAQVHANAAAAVQAAGAFVQPAATPGLTRGVNGELKGLDTSLTTFDDSGLGQSAGFDAAVQLQADQSQPSSSTATLTAARSATQGHPATHMVSVALQRGAEGAFMGTDRQFTIQLDPANLGKVKITLQFGENNTVKAKLLAERPETVSLLQKDAAMLERTLNNAGFNVTGDGLTFDLGQNGSFAGTMSQNGNSHQNGGNQGSDEDGTELAPIETVMPIFVDPDTGLTHVNVVI